MGLRDELKKKARLGLKSFLKRMDDFGEAVFGEEKKEETVEPKPEPKPTVQETVQEKTEESVTPPPPPPPNDDVTPGSGDDGGSPVTLFQQLAEASAMTNDIVRRLEAYGLGSEARDIVGATVGRDKQSINDMSALGLTAGLAVRQSQDALKLALEALNSTGNLDARARELKAQAERMAQSAEQTAKEVELQVEALNKKVEEMESKLGFDRFGDDDEYYWERQPLDFKMRDDPKEMYTALAEEWARIAPGVKRQDGNPVGKSPFAPLAFARGRKGLSAPVKIPMYAFANPEAFQIWAEDNGFGDGIAIEVKGLKYGQSGLSIIR